MDSKTSHSLNEEKKPTLFPITQQVTTKLLFPAFNKVSTGHTQIEDKDWLCNESFKSTDALIIQQQPTVSDHSGAESATDSDLAPVAKCAKTKESLGDGHKERRHKLKKKHKSHHKHKKHKTKHKEDLLSSNVKTEVEKPPTVSIKPPSGQVFIECVPGLRPDQAFRVDRMPDASNASFESIYKMHIGKYHRTGHSCLGLDKNHLITFGGDRKSHKKKPLDFRYFGKENVHMVKTVEFNGGVVDLSVASGEGGKVGDNVPYIAINEPRKDGGHSCVNPLGIYDASTEMYMQGQGPLIHEPKESRPTRVKESTEQVLKQRTATYNRALTTNPHDIEKWLEFIEFQDELITHQQNDQSDASSHEHRPKKHAMTQVLSEIKSAVFDRALEKNPTSVKLKIAHLEFAAPLWESGKVAAEWKRLVFVHMNDGALWGRYLLFAQSQFSSFSVSAVLKLYAKCFETLNSLLSGSVQSHPLLPDTGQHMIDIFTQLCHFVKHLCVPDIFSQLCQFVSQAGHTEKAVSFLQAQLEFNLFCPDVLTAASHRERLEFFEMFWDSGAPRVGEQGAVGWDVWTERKGDVEPVVHVGSSQEDDENKEADLLKTNAERWQKWHSLETFRQDQHWLPWRPDAGTGETEDDCTDPDRVVLSTDVVPYLISLGDDKPGKFSLLCRFLHFLGAPEMSDRTGCHGDDFNLFLDDMRQVRHALPSDCTTVFERGVSGDDNRLGVDTFIGNTVAQCFEKFTDVERTKVILMLMSFKAAGFGSVDGAKKAKLYKDMKKFTKSLMKEPCHRNNLAMWEAYARLEWSSGDVARARKVLDTAVAMSTTGHSIAGHDRCLKYFLHRSYVEMELGPSSCDHTVDIDRQRALHVLVALADGHVGSPYEPYSESSKTNPTVVLKSRNVYRLHLDELLTQTDKGWSYMDDVFASYAGDETLHWTVCYAAFEYLTHNIEAASAIFQHAIDQILERIASEALDNCTGSQQARNKHRTLVRWLTESHITLLYYHTQTQVVPLHVVRGPLEAALTEFPTNACLLRCYVALEARSSIAGRLRRYFYKATSNCQVALLWLFAMYAELRRLKMLAQYSQQVEPQLSSATGAADVIHTMGYVETGTSHRLRSLFERATNQAGVQHCVLLWRLYMNFEMCQGRKEAGRAVFYRALQHCPWAKVLYTDLVRLCPDRLMEATNLMEEKELRLRTPLEEVDLLTSLATDQRNDDEEQKRATSTKLDLIMPSATNGDNKEPNIPTSNADLIIPVALGKHSEKVEQNLATLSTDGVS